LAHLHEVVTSLPEGYETKVGERGLKLSGGERQRISIARAALKRPNLREISRSSTTLIIAHRLSTVVHADEIVVLAEGSIVERGTHAQLLQFKGAYAALSCAQQRATRQLNVDKG
jgi:ATP-binding cassette, subfamily B, heavy metal transporter